MAIEESMNPRHGGGSTSRCVLAAILTALIAVAAYAAIPRITGPVATGGPMPESAKPRGGSSGGIPLQINHQGLVKVNGFRFNGNGDFRFALVDPDTGENHWTNDGTNIPGPGVPTNAVNLPVVNGVYTIRLGDTTLANMTGIPSTVFNDDNVVLRIWFDDSLGNGIQQLSPDHVLTSAPYAFRVHDGVTLSEDQTITGSKTFTGAATFDAVTQLAAGSQSGDMFVHSPAGVDRLLPGAANLFLQSQGPGSPPIWASLTSVPLVTISDASATSDHSIGLSWSNVPGVELTFTPGHPSNRVLIVYNGRIDGGNQANAGAMRLTLDGSGVSGTVRSYARSGGFGPHPELATVTIVYSTTLSASSHTVRVQVKSTTGTDAVVKDRTIIVIEFHTNA